MPISAHPADSNPEPVRLPHTHVHEQQPDLVERVTVGLRAHESVVMGAPTERDRQRIVAAGKVAGKRIKRNVAIAVTENGVLIEFEDLRDPLAQPRQSPEVSRERELGPVPEEEDDPSPLLRFDPELLNPAGPRGGEVPDGTDPEADAPLPRRVPGTSPRPWEWSRRRS
ncbi:hypothetical protein HDA32_005530 [Spinactinospora alkalitolerans]|uniref:Uncharacterized protein n=1 Tax=Spinactinospora alkalitolerans TaxID=687207 RepID=A0A852U8Z7_9ACTN|nr:hypothetical protein [Spinactinospora alkalitolerans]NYE50410.1 hypothetical protein [Spinactinospora alkalitolerans]